MHPGAGNRVILLRILTINSGSSSIKFQLFDGEEPLLRGICDAIGLENSGISLEKPDNKDEPPEKEEKRIPNHETALKEILNSVKSFCDLSSISAVAHRVVHGGEAMREPIVVGTHELEEIRKLNNLAPLHNPHNILGIETMMKLLPSVKNIAVFDTAFHSTLPEEAFLYALPYEFYKEKKIRKYGFHGTSHAFVSKEAARILGSQKARIITCHLGNGASIAAVKEGKSIDTSMGMTPLEGLAMGTRSGDTDPAVVLSIAKDIGSPEAADKLLNKQSGLLGLSGISSDMRILHENESQEGAKRAMSVFSYRIVKYIGAYTAAMNGVDAIAFTGGIGENAWYIREKVLQHFAFLGLQLDPEKNKRSEQEISAPGSSVRVLVISTNEELEMAREAAAMLASPESP